MSYVCLVVQCVYGCTGQGGERELLGPKLGVTWYERVESTVESIDVCRRYSTNGELVYKTVLAGFRVC